jgi:hypothetical protein
MKRLAEYNITRPLTKKGKKEVPPAQVELDDSQEEELIRFEEPKPEEKFSKVQVAPWMTKRTRDINDSLLRFHNEIIEFCEYVSPTDAEHRLKELAFQE